MTPQEIRKIRGEASRKDFAAKIQYSHRTVEAWELGRKVPSDRAVAAMKATEGYLIKFGEVDENGDVYAKGCINQESIDNLRAEG